MFAYEFCEISKNTFFTEHQRTTASIIALENPDETAEIYRTGSGETTQKCSGFSNFNQ